MDILGKAILDLYKKHENLEERVEDLKNRQDRMESGKKRT